MPGWCWGAHFGCFGAGPGLVSGVWVLGVLCGVVCAGQVSLIQFGCVGFWWLVCVVGSKGLVVTWHFPSLSSLGAAVCPFPHTQYTTWVPEGPLSPWKGQVSPQGEKGRGMVGHAVVCGMVRVKNLLEFWAAGGAPTEQWGIGENTKRVFVACPRGAHRCSQCRLLHLQRSGFPLAKIQAIVKGASGSALVLFVLFSAVALLPGCLVSKSQALLGKTKCCVIYSLSSKDLFCRSK